MADEIMNELASPSHRLSDLRRRQALTQHQLATLMGVRQPRVSQLEGADLWRMELATLRAYVRALGGRLRLVAEFDDHELTLGSQPPSAQRVPVQGVTVQGVSEGLAG